LDAGNPENATSQASRDRDGIEHEGKLHPLVDDRLGYIP
jgi:hypothetical protein